MKTRILLIQTTLTLGNGTKERLENRGYRVVWAGSGLSALMLARNMPLDVIMLDIALPEIEGIDLCRLLRSRSETRHTPLILVTNRGYQPEQTSNSSGQPDAYLEKPYSDIDLDRKIAAVLSPKEPASERASIFEPSKASDISGWVIPEPRHALITTRQQLTKPEAEPVEQKETREPEYFGTDHAAWNQLSGAEPAVPAPPAADRTPHPAVDSQSTFSKWAGNALKKEPQSEDGLKQEPVSAGAETGLQQEPATGEPPAGDPDHPILPFHGSGAAVIDQDTGLFGRAQFEAMLDKEFKRALRFGQNMSVMLIDLDGRSRGQVADETLVRSLLSLVQKTIREVDTPAWWSGESFIVLLPNTSSTDALQAGARVLDAVALYPFSWPDASRITLNIGVAGLPNPSVTTQAQLIESANAAMKRAQNLMTPPPFKLNPKKK